MTAGCREATLEGASGSPGAPVDLLAAWRPAGFLMERRGAGIVATGELRRIEVPAGPAQVARAASMADAALSNLGVDGAIVAAALPYAGDIPAGLLLPERVTVTSIAPRDLDLRTRRAQGAAGASRGTSPGRQRAVPEAAAVARRPATAPEPAPTHPAPALRWRAEPSAAAYGRAVAEAISRIRTGELEKVVLTRSLVAPNPGLELSRLLAELRRRDPGCHLFAAPAAEGGAFVGATPETLLRRDGDRVLSLPHAGTAARSPDPGRDRQAAEALLRSTKDLHEHAAVVEAVADTLAPHCVDLRVDSEPHLAATAAVWHLATAVRGRLRPSAPSALALAAELHPTPAVCGTPRAAAGALIARLEPASRGLYAGLVGWVDGRGDGEWAVSLRCALVTRAVVRIHAGAGIVAESQPHLEVAETEVKFRTMIDALEACAAPPGAPAG
ncbi:MAG: isochorismate synthase MenF [Candidatus Dormibacteria bacterium]